MTERKPAGMSWETWRDELIRLARDEGAFDNLPGLGKPFTDLDQGYDPDWWVKKLVQREKVSVLPPGLELLRKVEAEQLLRREWKSRQIKSLRQPTKRVADNSCLINFVELGFPTHGPCSFAKTSASVALTSFLTLA